LYIKAPGIVGRPTAGILDNVPVARRSPAPGISYYREKLQIAPHLVSDINESIMFRLTQGNIASPLQCFPNRAAGILGDMDKMVLEVPRTLSNPIGNRR
jgi:hypothetical protein